MANRLSLDMDAPARAVKCSQVLTVHGSDDETIPVADAHAYAERLVGGRLLVVDGADHNYKQPAATNALIKAVVGHIAGGAGERAEKSLVPAKDEKSLPSLLRLVAG